MKLYFNLILKKLPPFFIMLLVFSKTSMALIIRTDDLSFIEKEITTGTKDTLVIFDVDEVLIVGKDQARHPYYQDCIVSECSKITNTCSEEEAFRLFSIMWEQAKAELVNPAFAPLIQNLSKKKKI